MRTEYIKACANWIEYEADDYILANQLRKCVANNDREFIRWIGHYINNTFDWGHIGNNLIAALDEYDDTLY